MTTVFLIINLPFFIFNKPIYFVNEVIEFIVPTFIFNTANIFYIISIILYLLAFLQIDNSAIELEIPSQIDFKGGNIPIGRILRGSAKKKKFFLSIRDLEKHMFICGATGTGKSNFLQNFLINFTKIFKIPFFLVEFKGEYHFLQKKIDNVLILWPGENFSINIFNPENASPIIHAERIFDILKSGQFIDESSEYSPQMENVLVDILIKVCESKNFRSWKGFEYFCEKYRKENKNKIPMLSQTLISIKNRIRRFSKGPLKALFENENEISMNNLFKRNVLLDLSSIIRLGGEKEDAFFFLNMILKYLWDKNLTEGAQEFENIKHITIIEDAQYFAPQDLMKKSKLTTYLEDIALLQRGTGECLITLATRPDISKEILANNGIVLTFKNHMEKDIMCELLNLDLENKNYLSFLDEGKCIIRVNSIKEPFLLKIPLVKRELLTISEIHQNNRMILRKSRGNYDLDSKSKIKKSLYVLKEFIHPIRYVFPKKSKNHELIYKKTKQNGFQIRQFSENKTDSKRDPLNYDLELNSYKSLKNLINDLYEMQKKKE